MGVLSPAGAARERATTCVKCHEKTWAFDRLCAFCRPDAHEAAEATADYLAEKAQ